MKIYINREPHSGPYGGGNMFVKAFHRLVPDMGHELVSPMDPNAIPDVILAVGLPSESPCIGVEQAIMYRMINPRVKVVLRVNENDARKNTSHMDDALRRVSGHIDGTVWVSNYMRDYFRGRWDCVDQTVIINGVDREVFKPGEKLDNGKVNIVAHHWSDNRMKGADVYEAIDEFVGRNPDRFTFTYIGRTRSHLPHTNVIRPLSGKRLGEELGKYDIYVSGSRHDPGPNHILEALACGLPTLIHPDGGGCVEFAGEDHRYSDIANLWGALAASNVMPIPPNTALELTGWETCVSAYVKYLEGIVNE